MTIYGTPDFWRPPTPAGQLVAGGKGFPATTTAFPMQTTSDYSCLAIRLRPTGVITGYAVTVNFYMDQAGTQLVETYVWHSFNGALIMDNIVPLSPYFNVQFTAAASGGGQTFDFYVIGLAGTQPIQTADNASVLANFTGSIGAGANISLFASVCRGGSAMLAFDTAAAAWNVQVGGFNYTTGVISTQLSATNITHQARFVSTLILPRYTERVFVQNNDGVAQNFDVALVAA